jgi:hypothetical protein
VAPDLELRADVNLDKAVEMVLRSLDERSRELGRPRPSQD